MMSTALSITHRVKMAVVDLTFAGMLPYSDDELPPVDSVRTYRTLPADVGGMAKKRPAVSLGGPTEVQESMGLCCRRQRLSASPGGVEASHVWRLLKGGLGKVGESGAYGISGSPTQRGCQNGRQEMD